MTDEFTFAIEPATGELTSTPFVTSRRHGNGRSRPIASRCRRVTLNRSRVSPRCSGLMVLSPRCAPYRVPFGAGVAFTDERTVRQGELRCLANRGLPRQRR